MRLRCVGTARGATLLPTNDFLIHATATQIGVDSPSLPVFEILLALLGGAIVVSAVDTFHRFATNTMPETDAQRYAYFVANPLGEVRVRACPLRSLFVSVGLSWACW